MSQKKMAMEWAAEQHAQEQAGKLADAIVLRLGLSAPVDPLRIAKDERPVLRVGGRNFRNRFDGKLTYDRAKKCFLLMYNTKYDVGYTRGPHHPRTRFSISHELAHYFIEHHHAYLRQDGKPHPSVNEFRSVATIEREADAFAASLLLPTHLIRSRVNKAELSLSRLDRISEDFQTSLVSTTIRCVRLSDFPCAVAGIRGGELAWMFPSEALIKAGLYPRRGHLPTNASAPWVEFLSGAEDRSQDDGRVRDWFRTYEREQLEAVYVREEYVPAQVLGTLLVLLTLDERDVFPDEDEEYEDE